MRPARALALALALLAGGATLVVPAAAQDRPAEADLFAAPQGPPAPEAGGAPAARPAAPAGARPGEAELFGPAPAGGEAQGRPEAEARVRGRLGETDDALKLGGLLYLRSALTAREGAPPSDWAFSTPALLDLYLDARPNDRVRGFALARTVYDATLPKGPTVQAGLPVVLGTSQANPHATLDQLWLKFDADRKVFLTAGRQHVKWGVGRFWNPTDFLHVARRDPLAVFDERAGTTMLKAHLPWEARGWNLYGMAVAEPLVTPVTSPLVPPTLPAPTNRLGAVGGAARAEVVLGSWELGIDGAAQRGMDPRLGLDASTGFWEIDVRGELALRRGSDVPLVREVAVPGGTTYEAYTPTGLRTAAVLAADWSHKYSDEDAFTLGVEYYWNQNGYDDARLYPVALLANLFTPFGMGRHYGGVYLALPRPGAWNLHTFTFTVLGNLSDTSFTGRVDWSMTLLTHLTLEAYVAGHAGTKGGELRFGLDVAPRTVVLPPATCSSVGGTPGAGGACTTPTLSVGAPIADAGLALRLAL